MIIVRVLTIYELVYSVNLYVVHKRQIILIVRFLSMLYLPHHED